MSIKRTIETDEWRLGCYFEWRPKYSVKSCQFCGGKGEVGGGFKDLDGPQECPECFGTGTIKVPPTTAKPEIPQEIAEHMRRAWWDFFNEKKAANNLDDLVEEEWERYYESQKE